MAVKKLLFLIIKLKEVSKTLEDMEQVILDDKRIKYLIWGLDAAEARVLLLKILNSEEIDETMIKMAAKAIN
jgi:hypothetical protein